MFLEQAYKVVKFSELEVLPFLSAFILIMFE
jgi:hypothetical protein